MKLAIIDIGSNSTKLLVADETGHLHEDLTGCRISTGIGSSEPLVLSSDTIEVATAVTLSLFNQAQAYSPDETLIVATSAVREATNQNAFCESILQATGTPVRVLSGSEEAQYIAYGVATDLNLQDKPEFCLFDAGGGSIECIHFKDKKIQFAESFPLGIVRLNERHVCDPKTQVTQSEIEEIKKTITQVTGDFPVPGVPLVGTGGGLSAARKILGPEAWIPKEELETLLIDLASMPMCDRMEKFSIPEFRADLMPAAIAITLAFMEKGRAGQILHSFFNLRYGIAAKLLSQGGNLEL